MFYHFKICHNFKILFWNSILINAYWLLISIQSNTPSSNSKKIEIYSFIVLTSIASISGHRYHRGVRNSSPKWNSRNNTTQVLRKKNYDSKKFSVYVQRRWILQDAQIENCSESKRNTDRCKKEKR